MSSAESDLINKLRDQEITTENLQRDLGKVKQQLEDARLSEAKLLSSQKNEVDVSNEQVRELTRAKDEMESKLFAAKGEKGDLEGKLKQLEETLSRQERDMRGMQLELQAKTTDLGDINTREADMKQMTRDTENARKRSAELEGINKELHSELKTCKGTVQTLQSEIKETINKIEKMNETVAGLEDENEQLKEEMNDLTESQAQQASDALNSQSDSRFVLPTINFPGGEGRINGNSMEDDQVTARGEGVSLGSLLPALNKVSQECYTPRTGISLATPLLQEWEDSPNPKTSMVSKEVQTAEIISMSVCPEHNDDDFWVCPCVIC